MQEERQADQYSEDHSEPLVSIITPTYNSERFIKETIGSVQAQTYANWEMLIVDDCSTDGTVQAIQSYTKHDNRIKLFQLNENQGPAVARNTAIEQSKGRYLAFLDSDDLWLPEKLQRQIAFMQQMKVGFSFTKYMKIKEDGTETNSIVDIPTVVDYKHLLKHNVIGCLTVILDKELVGEVRMVNIRSRQDYVLWLQLCKKGFKAYGLQEVLAKYRLVENSVSSDKIKMALQRWRVYREVEGINLIKSSWYFMNYAFYTFKKYVS